MINTKMFTDSSSQSGIRAAREYGDVLFLDFPAAGDGHVKNLMMKRSISKCNQQVVGNVTH